MIVKQDNVLPNTGNVTADKSGRLISASLAERPLALRRKRMMAHHTLFFPIKLPFECQSIRPLTIQFARKPLGVFCLLRLGLKRGVGRASVPASPLLAATPGLAGTLA